MTERPWLIIPIETKVRELDAKVLTGYDKTFKADVGGTRSTFGWRDMLLKFSDEKSC